MEVNSRRASFDKFVRLEGARLQRVTCARFGLQLGSEAAADALGWAWEHWARVGAMDNPVGYLYRVAQTSVRRQQRWQRPIGLAPEPRGAPTDVEPGLESALTRLSANQRVAVVLVHGLGWSYQETADALNVSLPALRNHVHRGLARLRRELGESS